MTTNAPYYHEVAKEKEVFEHAYKNKIPFLLKGPTGTGKSRFIEHMAHQLDKKIITISCHEETSSTDLIGRFIIKGAETIWLDGPLTTAVKEGAIIYLDEVAEARPDVIVAIHSLTDHRRELFIDKLGENVKAHEDFMLVASFNPGYQRGFKELKPSTRQRFIPAPSSKTCDSNSKTAGLSKPRQTTPSGSIKFSTPTRVRAGSASSALAQTK